MRIVSGCMFLNKELGGRNRIPVSPGIENRMSKVGGRGVDGIGKGTNMRQFPHHLGCILGGEP